jgi:hypothetical protein
MLTIPSLDPAESQQSRFLSVRDITSQRSTFAEIISVHVMFQHRPTTISDILTGFAANAPGCTHVTVRPIESPFQLFFR